jgi:2-keto-4-pentenoate hydratase
MSSVDPSALARELLAASAGRQPVAVPPSARDEDFDLAAAYAVANELTRLRRAAGRSTVGVKVGFANKAVWRALKLQTLAWGPMYDDTVHYATNGESSLAIARMVSPKIEPEIVFRLKRPIGGGHTIDASEVLDAVEWIALGFEVIDCPFPDWKFQPTDFVAAFGLHAALIVGTPKAVEAASLSAIADELAAFQVRLMNDGQTVAEGSGRNSLRNPALCLGELASAMDARADAGSLATGDLVSSGTLTESQLIAAGQVWRAEVSGIALEPLTLRIV